MVAAIITLSNPEQSTFHVLSKADATLAQRLNTIVEKILCIWYLKNCINVAIATSRIYFPRLRQGWCNVVSLTSWRSCKHVDAILTLQQSCQCIIYSRPWIKTTVKATLEQRFNFEVVESTSLQHCVLVVQCCNFITTFCVCWENVLHKKWSYH